MSHTEGCTMTFEEQLQKTGKLIYTNCGVSMMPLLREKRDLMLIEQISRPIRKYDAVLFVRPGVEGRGKYVLHRVLRCNPDGTYFIIGDNTISGETVRRENIIGILTAVKRNGKQISVEDWKYRVYVRAIWWTYPIRIFWKKVRRHCKRALKRRG